MPSPKVYAPNTSTNCSLIEITEHNLSRIFWHVLAINVTFFCSFWGILVDQLYISSYNLQWYIKRFALLHCHFSYINNHPCCIWEYIPFYYLSSENRRDFLKFYQWKIKSCSRWDGKFLIENLKGRFKTIKAWLEWKGLKRAPN